MARLLPIQILGLFTMLVLAWLVPSQSAIAHPWHELESPNTFFNAAELTPQLTLMGLGIAFAFGAIHALAPGHGKTMVAAYLVGNRGTAKHAFLLGVVTTISHTFSVLCLAILALVASQYVVPEQIYPVLSGLSGLTVLGVGLWLFRQSFLSMGNLGLAFVSQPSQPLQHEHHHEGHSGHHHHEHADHHPDHHPDHLHDHDETTHRHHSENMACGCEAGHHHMPETLSLKSLVALGIAGGMVPCPSALVLLLSAIAFHQEAYGLVLVTGFSLGLASVLIALGLTVVYAKRWFETLPSQGTWFRYLPMASASVIILTGIVLTSYAVMPTTVY